MRKQSDEQRGRVTKATLQTLTDMLSLYHVLSILLMFYDEQETLEKVIVDIPSRTFTIVSSSGDTKKISCNSDQFMRVLEIVREMVPVTDVSYV